MLAILPGISKRDVRLEKTLWWYCYEMKVIKICDHEDPVICERTKPTGTSCTPIPIVPDIKKVFYNLTQLFSFKTLKRLDDLKKTTKLTGKGRFCVKEGVYQIKVTE